MKYSASDFIEKEYIRWAEKDKQNYRKIWEDSVGDTVLFINKGKIFAIAKIEELDLSDGEYELGYFWNDNIRFVDIPLVELNVIIGYKENYFPRNYMLANDDNLDEVFEFLNIYKYINLIDNFKLEMEDGKKFEINTVSNNSSFTCYMTKNSDTLKIRTSTGNERYTAFINLNRYFKNEKVKDEASYVKAICEWLVNKDVNTYINIKDMPEEKKELEKTETMQYPRNEQYKYDALKSANFKCEIDESHITFISKITGTNYVEGHHLIPISQYAEFEHDVDVRANIVSLCPTCHRKIHSGINEDVYVILKELHKKREDRLKKVGLDITLEELKLIYLENIQ